MREGNSGNVVHFEWKEQYDDMINRFEDFIDIENIKTVDDLYKEMHDWLGITRTGRFLPSQKQMDLFSEYYEQPYYDVGAYERQVREVERKFTAYEYSGNRHWNQETHEFIRPMKDKTGKIITYTHHYGVLDTISFPKRGVDIQVIRDKKFGYILAWHKDITHQKYLGSQY
jgi:hypothetical protein